METAKKEFKEERFEFAVFMNNIIICKRYFKVYNFIEGSMETMDFKETVDDIVKMIDDDLKSKSRIHTWYYYNPEDEVETDEFHSPLLDPWACTFKFAVYDNRREVFSKIWDGYAYPRSVRNRIDLTNKTVRYTNREGKLFVFDKETFFNDPDRRLLFEQEVLKAQIMDKEDLLSKITRMICKICSPSRDDVKMNGRVDKETNEMYLGDFTTTEKYGEKEYAFPLKMANKDVVKQWEDLLKEKTKTYFKNLF